MGPITRLFQRTATPKRKSHKLDLDQASRELSKDITNRVKFRPAAKRDIETLKLTIIAAARGCLKSTESRMHASAAEEQRSLKFLIQCEFFCFFVNLANRQLLAEFGESAAQYWEENEGMNCINEFLDSLPGEWDPQMRERLQGELYDKISQAELTYGMCLGLLATDDGVYSGNGMFNQLGCRTARLAQIHNPVAQLSITMTAAGFFLNLKFQERVKKTAHQLALHRVAA